MVQNRLGHELVRQQDLLLLFERVLHEVEDLGFGNLLTLYAGASAEGALTALAMYACTDVAEVWGRKLIVKEDEAGIRSRRALLMLSLLGLALGLHLLLLVLELLQEAVVEVLQLLLISPILLLLLMVGCLDLALVRDFGLLSLRLDCSGLLDYPQGIFSRVVLSKREDEAVVLSGATTEGASEMR